MRSGILGLIIAERKVDVARNKRDRRPSSLIREAGPLRPLFRSESPFVLIAECKKASPSRGLLVADYDPVAIALAYQRGRAGAVSVLTEEKHFMGADAHLAAVREATTLPVLRKDFIVDPYQIRESWALGADAVLLIAAALDRPQIAELSACASELSLEVLFEIHGEAELEAAFAARRGGVHAVGVNARNLSDFSVDSAIPLALAPKLPPGAVKVAESGLRRPEAAAALLRAGYRAFLVGESFLTAPDREAAVRSFATTLASEAASEAAAEATGENGREVLRDA